MFVVESPPLFIVEDFGRKSILAGSRDVIERGFSSEANILPLNSAVTPISPAFFVEYKTLYATPSFVLTNSGSILA